MPIRTIHVDPGTDLAILDAAQQARAKNPKLWAADSTVIVGLIRAALAAGLEPIPSPVKRGRSRGGDAQGRILRLVGKEGRVSFDRAAKAGAPELDQAAVLNLVRNGILAWAPGGQVMLGIMGASARDLGIDDPIGGGPSERVKGGWASQIMGTPAAEVPGVPADHPKDHPEENTLAGWADIIISEQIPRRERMGLKPGEHYQGCPLAGTSGDTSCCR